MKKILCVMIVLSVFFTGCSKIKKDSSVVNVPQSFTADITINNRSLESTASVEKTKSFTKLVFSLPTEINGLTLTQSESGLKTEFAGLSASFSKNIFSQKSAVSIIYNVINYTNENISQCGVKKQIDKYVITGTVNEQEFELIINSKTSAIISLCISSEQISIFFSNFSES